MNQDNSFNKNNFNSQGDNGVVNNQPLKRKKSWLIIGIVLLIVGIALILIGKSLIKTDLGSSVNRNDFDDTVIVIRNNQGLYGFFDFNGEKISDFQYKTISSFVNGSALVKNESNEYGIINTKGEMIVPFGKYRSILTKEYFYQATDKESNKYLLDFNGNEVYDLKDKTVTTNYLAEKIIIVKSDEYFDVLDYTGKSLVKLERVGDENYKLYNTSRDDGEFVTIFYQNTTYVIDTANRKLMNTISSDKAYCVSSIDSSDSNKYIMVACDGSGKFTYMNGKKELFSTDTYSNLFISNSNVIGTTSTDRYILDNKGNILLEYYMSNLTFLNGYDYITKDSDVTNFYVNGKLVKTVECSSQARIFNRSNQTYILKDLCSNEEHAYAIYSKKGEKIADVNYYTINAFDSNNIATAIEDRKYYMIDEKGGKISSGYSNISGEKMSDGINISIDNNIIYVAKNDKTTYILDSSGKEIMSTEEYVTNYGTYFTVGSSKYYTTSGKLFYDKNGDE